MNAATSDTNVATGGTRSATAASADGTRSVPATAADGTRSVPATLRTARGSAAAVGQRGLKVAYVVSRFPKLTETFVLYEILALEEQGVEVEVFPLLGMRNAATSQGASLWSKMVELIKKPAARPLMHPEAAALVRRVNYLPFLSWSVLRAQVYYLVRRPAAYFGALAALLRGTWGSVNFLIGGLAVFPKTALMAYKMETGGTSHIHAHFANHPAAAAFLIHRLTGIPYSFTAHGSDLHMDRHMLREKVRDARRVVTISHYNKELIVAECGEACRDKISVVRCGVDTRVFEPAPEESAPECGVDFNSHNPPEPVDPSRRNGPEPKGASPGAFTLVCIGTMHEVKGHTYLIEACRLLREGGIDFACHLVGGGPDRAALERQAVEAGLGDRVIFHGLRTREQVAALLKRAHVLVAPSVLTQDGRREGIPVVLMEAMAAGVPVVASNLSGIPELVIDGVTGLLAPPRDARALAEALERLQRDPELRRMFRRAGREKVVREFDLRTNAAILAGLFSDSELEEVGDQPVGCCLQRTGSPTLSASVATSLNSDRIGQAKA